MRRMVETFATGFPHVLPFMPASLLIRSDQSIAFDRLALRVRLVEPAAAAHLARGNAQFEDHAAMFGGAVGIWSPETIRKPGDAKLTDGFPRDEFYLNNRLSPAQSAVQLGE
jgi:hypothetical protein